MTDAERQARYRAARAADAPVIRTRRPANVWDYLRANKLSRLVWDSYDDIVTACKEAWHFLVTDPKRIASIGTRESACVNG